MTTNEIKEKLINEYHIDKKEVKNLSKEDLEIMLMQAQVLESAKPMEAVSDNNEQIPAIGSPEWTDYVMSLFIPEELDNKAPKADGLRRVAFKLLGPFNVTSNVVQSPSVQNNDRATVTVTLEFHYDQRVITASADVFSGNTQREYAKHPVATAETRAEGRALRKALMLTKIVTAEELYDAGLDEPNGSDNRIATSMLTGLKIMCDRQNIDLHKMTVKMGYKINTIDDITKDQGIAISNKLVEFTQGKETISEDILK